MKRASPRSGVGRLFPWSRLATPPEESAAASRVRVAHVRRAHGLRGELLIRALTARPEALFTPGRLFYVGDDPGAATLTLRGARTTHDGWLLAFEDVSDRTSAERWRGIDLWTEQPAGMALGSDLPFAGDLVGMRVELADGTVLGSVANYYDLPQGPILEVARGEELVLFPLHPEFISRVDDERGALVVDPPAGLFD